jgi:ABC-type multidrug transport system ATPase subunit
MNVEKPDKGWLYLGPTVRTAYLPQLVGFSNEERSALDTMLWDCRCQPQEARDRLAAFGFRGEDVFTPVGALSGGEKSRLRLCMLMGADINFLILDEPTNHLDIASREWMEDALSDYEQTLLFVSHDRYFIDKFATRVWELRDGHITDFRGSYQEFRAWRDRQELVAQIEKQKEPPKEKKGKPVNRALVEQFIQSDEIAERFAQYYLLFTKYRSDYQIATILDGDAAPEIRTRAQSARLDERLAVVRLILDALDSRLVSVLETEQTISTVRYVLRRVKDDVVAGASAVETIGAIADELRTRMRPHVLAPGKKDGGESCREKDDDRTRRVRLPVQRIVAYYAIGPDAGLSKLGIGVLAAFGLDPALLVLVVLGLVKITVLHRPPPLIDISSRDACASEITSANFLNASITLQIIP